MKNEQLYSNPGNVLKEFMEAWLYQDYDKMYTLVNKAWASKYTRDFLWEMYSAVIIDDYEITVPPGEVTAALISAEVRIMVNKLWLNPALVVLVCETEAYKASLHGDWGVNPISTMKLFRRPETWADRREKERLNRKMK